MNTHSKEPGMSTSYHLSIGYNSGCSCPKELIKPEQSWELLKSAVLVICGDPALIVAEARKFGAPEQCANGPECCTLEGHAERYKTPWTDQTIRFNEKNKQVIQIASGDREVKEHVRRAFCRLVIAAMHKYNIEVNMEVV
jgi:hypothetical protein